MKLLKLVFVIIFYCGVGYDIDFELESSDFENFEEELLELDNCIFNLIDSSDDELGEEMFDNSFLLYFFYDCEGIGGLIYKDYIVEIVVVF